jgi:uncharacterized membrane protein
MNHKQLLLAADGNMEKCHGVARAGKNDCACAAAACSR